MNFEIRQLNSPFDDSAFFIRNVYHRNSMLLDCGRLGRLGHSEVMSLSDIFISHTHMDHFFGFDRILRGSIIRNDELRVYGPPGFIDNVDGKFRGYTWNLAEDYGFSMRAYELHPNGAHKMALFESKNRFVPTISEFTGNTLDLDFGFTGTFEFFDHRTISMGYRISEPIQFTVLPERLSELGYRQGNWLSMLKRALTSGIVEDIYITLSDNSNVIKRSDELAEEITVVKPPESVTYITDCAPTDDNIEKAIKFAKDTDLLIIESVFLDEDIEHAVQKNHLTVGLSKKIVSESNAKQVRFTHFAARYEMSKGDFMNNLYDGMSGKIFRIEEEAH